jgi:hypothetical protein
MCTHAPARTHTNIQREREREPSRASASASVDAIACSLETRCMDNTRNTKGVQTDGNLHPFQMATGP